MKLTKADMTALDLTDNLESSASIRDGLTMIVVVTFNAERWIHQCLRSSLESTLLPQIVVIDNNSEDDTVRIIEEHYPQVHLIAGKDNLGFGMANNIGISYAIKQNAQFVFLLNQDAWIDPDCLNAMISRFGEIETPGIVSPLHMNYQGSRLHDGFTRYLGCSLDVPPQSGFVQVNFVPAALWLVPTSVLVEVGGFDPVFFMYGEDDDLAARIRNSGRSIVVNCLAKGFHAEKTGSVTSKRYAASYFQRNVSFLRFSNRSIVPRYSIWMLGVIRDLLQNVCSLRLRKVWGVVIAAARTLTRVSQIETSKSILENSASPFLDVQ